ncbi:hypothetical protein GGS26DRAFT_594475 [Hypomontagnella submonticulosa]|nr:hypothetical protein GGS26DRAFT_594475 [Hypomontagnella submonticulosa]
MAPSSMPTSIDERPPSNPKPPLHIPNELLMSIIEHLQLPPVDVELAIIPEEFLQKRSALRNLCLASKKLGVYARPLLYQTVVFYLDSGHAPKDPVEAFGGLRELMLLVRTLITKPAYCSFINNIVCIAGLRCAKWWSGDVVPAKALL